jgi:hypothetical protein
MAKPNRNASQTKYTQQYMENASFDEDIGVLTRLGLGFDGQSAQFNQASSLALKITESGGATYIAVAAPGTNQDAARWQCKKVDESDGVVITWADGNANFDNIATDLTALSYS